MSSGFHIEHVPSRNKAPRADRRSTIDDKKQALGSAEAIPGTNLLNRNRNVSDILASISTRPRWHVDAPCSQADPEAFFPEKGESTANAKRICGRCDVREQCLEWALDNNERFGVFGGKSERERRRILERRRMAAEYEGGAA
ncbi:WhiB family transcription factor [Gordonia phage CheeseTouch]